MGARLLQPTPRHATPRYVRLAGRTLLLIIILPVPLTKLVQLAYFLWPLLTAATESFCCVAPGPPAARDPWDH